MLRQHCRNAIHLTSNPVRIRWRKGKNSEIFPFLVQPYGIGATVLSRYPRALVSKKTYRTVVLALLNDLAESWHVSCIH
jgi:hypothetical protein